MGASSGQHEDGFPERFRKLRSAKNLSQEELGRLVGVHANHLGRYERGLSKPSADTLQRIAEALGVSSDYLINGSSETFARARFEDRELLEMFQKVEKFPENEKFAVKEVLDAFIARRQVREMAAQSLQPARLQAATTP